ncbi:formimidoylglutamase [Pelistega ratti]|nr:formimidoylglutamase [Pelistega ratti]
MMQSTYTWTGRVDGTTPEHLRFHQVINQYEKAEYTLLGFCSDEGVIRNKGRQGAALAPNTIRQQLASLPIHQAISIKDGGNIICQEGKLEQAQTELAQKITATLLSTSRPIVLGGGHEVAYGSFMGVFHYLQQISPKAKLGIINFDAHFDLRQADRSTSGTPFLQAAKYSLAHQSPFHYFCLGIAKHGNTKVLFDTADQLGCQYVYDYEINHQNLSAIQKKLADFIDAMDMLYVTVDLDVFHSAVAPGVSAPAVRGVDLVCFETLFQQIKQSQKICLLDIAECNPHYDIDNRTAKLAAYIVYQYLT